MAYTKQTWADDPAGGTPVDAESLNYIEDGIEDAHIAVDDVIADVATLTTDVADLETAVANAGALLAIETTTMAQSTTTSTSYQILNFPITVTVPSNGKLLYQLEGFWHNTSDGFAVSIGVHDGTSVLADRAPAQVSLQSKGVSFLGPTQSLSFLLTGLTPGVSITLKPCFLRAYGGGTATITPKVAMLWKVP